MSYEVCAMNKKYRGYVFATIVSLAISLCATCNDVCAQVPCEYDVTIIQAPTDCGIFGTVITVGLGLNENGAVVGRYQCPLWEHNEAFVWTAEDGFITLDRPEGVYSASAVDINDNGVICGSVLVSGLGFRGFVYEAGKWTILDPVVPDAGWSSASAINNAGVVVGQRSITENLNPQVAYLWSEDEGFTDLVIVNGPNGGAFDISQSGLIGGWDGTAFFTDDSTAVLWENEQPVQIGSIPGGFATYVRAITEDGAALLNGRIIADQSSILLGHIWQDDKFTLISPIQGYDTSGAADMNNALLAIGLSVNLSTPTDRRGYLWQSGITFDLNDLISTKSPILIETGGAINNVGQIVANGNNTDGEILSFLLSPMNLPLGDLNGDCSVEIFDLVILLTEWGELNSPADLNNDGVVSTADLLALFANWG